METMSRKTLKSATRNQFEVCFSRRFPFTTNTRFSFISSSVYNTTTIVTAEWILRICFTLSFVCCYFVFSLQTNKGNFHFCHRSFDCLTTHPNNEVKKYCFRDFKVFLFLFFLKPSRILFPNMLLLAPLIKSSK